MSTPALQGPWYVPFARNPAFVGRAEELARLHAALAGATEEGGQAVVGIRPAGVTGVTGMGGMGKTQLAVEYAYRYAAHYPGGVFWLNAAGDWLAEFAALGTYLDPSCAGEPQEMQIRAAAIPLARLGLLVGLRKGMVISLAGPWRMRRASWWMSRCWRTCAATWCGCIRWCAPTRHSRRQRRNGRGFGGNVPPG